MATEEPSTPAAEVWTVQRILLWTTSFLRQRGVESARLEAELLLSHARKCPRIRLYMDLETQVTDDERARMREMVQRRAKREPLAYIVGNKEFYGRNFVVGAGVLIPRPETETLVDVCLEHLPRDVSSEVIEVGFGAGCVAITIALQRELCRVKATDLSSAAMRIATQNCERYGLADRVTLLQDDALEPFLKDAETLYDGLVSNPPYVCDGEWAELQPEVGLHEPREALLAGEDGLNVVRKIATGAARILKTGAFIALELDPAQCETVAELLTNSGFRNARIRRDLSGLNRIVEAIRAERSLSGGEVPH
jgi:release factor glutamine methyltransferase